MGIAHEMISNSEGQTSYRVRVSSFKHKMNTWKHGRVIHLKTFKIDGVKLKLKIYPNGETEDSVNSVSIFIENKSDVDIDMLFDIKMGTKKTIKDLDWHYAAGECFGWDEFYRHDQYDDDVEDEDYEITFTVKKLWKEVNEDCVYNNVSDNVKSVQKRLESLEKSMKKIDKLEALEKSVKSLIKKSGESKGDASVQRPPIPYPECPICMENMTQNTRIMQCSAGHLICGDCYENLNPKVCPTCKNEIIGRCHGMESYLRTLFPSN